MKLVIATLVGSEVTLDVEPNEKVRTVKERLEEKEGIPPEQQRLVYDGKHINDDASLDDYRLQDGAKLNLVLSLRGGRC